MIKYIGSKRKLVPTILEMVRGLPDVHSVLDLFSGTSRVGHALKASGYQVHANDLNAYAATLATCYVQADYDDHRDIDMLIGELSMVRGEPGWFTKTYCEDSRFFQPHNGELVDAMRETIDRWGFDPELESILLTSLMEAADRVDSTTGVQMAYLKSWAKRSHNSLSLRTPELLALPQRGRCRATQLDAHDAATVSVDLAYLDPPYNQHKYLGNYHIWESLVRWDKPEVYGIARKRIDCKDRKSPFNSKPRCADALRDVVAALDCKWILLSFSDEGYLDREQLEAILETRGTVTVSEVGGHARYVGARIGIHNPAGNKVGTVSHTTNTERLYLVEVR